MELNEFLHLFLKMSLRTKQRMLKEDAEIFKQKRFFEEQVRFPPGLIDPLFLLRLKKVVEVNVLK